MSMSMVSSCPGIHGPPSPGTDSLATGPSRSEIFQNFDGLGFLKFSRSCSGPVLGLGPNRSIRDQPVLVRESLLLSVPWYPRTERIYRSICSGRPHHCTLQCGRKISFTKFL